MTTTVPLHATHIAPQHRSRTKPVLALTSLLVVGLVGFLGYTVHSDRAQITKLHKQHATLVAACKAHANDSAILIAATVKATLGTQPDPSTNAKNVKDLSADCK